LTIRTVLRHSSGMTTRNRGGARRFLRAGAAAAALAAVPSWAAGGGAHADPIAPAALAIAVILAAAKLGGDLAVRLGQPAVLGELLMGLALGNVTLLGIDVFEPMAVDPAVDILARLGVLILLFEVGLESTVGEMLKAGWSSVLVAVLGVAAPFLLGWGVGALLLPDASTYVHLFLGATLTATSVGITARVLQDLGRSQSTEARIILGAAVIDDVLGLVMLAVVSGLVAAADAGGTLSLTEVLVVLAKAAAFLVGALALGTRLSPGAFALASRLRARGVLISAGLAFCFLLSWLASAVGLAAIVGAFAAGLILEDVHYREFVRRGEHGLEELLHPVSQFLVPIFFVVMGMRTDLTALASGPTLGLAAALTVAAVAGKQICGLGVVRRGVDRVSVGIGMVPRGEVGLIFASIGVELTLGGRPLLDERVFSGVVAMVIVTTLLTPPALRWSLARSRAGA
jgi:Kef-type K+ transport system membrane component KefB